MRVYMLITILAATIAYLLVPAVLRLALRVGALTQVRARDVHTVPIARLGGVAMLAGIAGALAIGSRIPYLANVLAPTSQAWAILAGAAAMALVGVADDIWELDWYTKLAGEILAAGVMAFNGVQFVTLPFMGLTVGSSRLAIVATILVVVVVANAVNFMDGLDGLACGIIAIAATAFFIYCYMLTRNATPGDYTSVACAILAALVGACLGFLPHNFHPARLFMGDSGALTLGLIIAGAGIQVTGQIDPVSTSLGYALPAYLPLLLSVAVILLPLVDFVWAVVRRLARGQSPFHADAGHLHHRALHRAHSHAGAVLILYMWAAIFSFSCVALVVLPAREVLVVAAAAVLVGVGITSAVFHRASLRAAEHAATGDAGGGDATTADPFAAEQRA